MRDLVLLSVGSAVVISVAAVLIGELIPVVLLGSLGMALAVAVIGVLPSRSAGSHPPHEDQMELFDTARAGNGGFKSPQV